MISSVAADNSPSPPSYSACGFSDCCPKLDFYMASLTALSASLTS